MNTLFLIPFLAFFSEYMDATLGMGYGTTLTPLLLILGFKPLEIVPAVLFSQFVTSLMAGFFHHRFGNVDFRRESFHLKVVFVLAFSGIVGSIVAVFISLNVPQLVVKTYIGLMVLVIGMAMLFNMNKSYGFSWRKVVGFGLIAAFNKGISGGGYGPVVTGGQILSGLDEKNAVAITSLAEGLICIVAVAVYFATRSVESWKLIPYVLIGALISVPFAAVTVRMINPRVLRTGIAVLTILLGVATLLKIATA